MVPDVYVVYLQWNTDFADRGRALEALLDRVFPGSPRHILVVDNAIAACFEFRAKGNVDVISGDNTLREFSAWNRGIAWLDSMGRPSDDSIALIANDTYQTGYGDAYLRAITRRHVQSALARNGLFGHIDAYPRPVRLLGLTFQRWIRSSLIIAKWGTLRRLLPFGIPIPDSDIFSNDKEFFKVSAPLSENYRTYIRSWLFDDTKKDSEFPYTWHSKTALTPDTFGDMVAKARCILCEHYFSAVAQSKGIPLCTYSRGFPGRSFLSRISKGMVKS
jgi:hypothetical protein